VTTKPTCDRHRYEPLVAHRPNIDQAARDALADLGLIDDDRTEDLHALIVAEAGTT
jgi:hypothetical protein